LGYLKRKNYDFLKYIVKVKFTAFIRREEYLFTSGYPHLNLYFQKEITVIHYRGNCKNSILICHARKAEQKLLKKVWCRIYYRNWGYSQKDKA